MDAVPLENLEEGTTGTIQKLAEGTGFRRRLESLGIREGKTVRLVARHPFCGPIVIEMDDRHITLGRGMAKRILVTPLQA